MVYFVMLVASSERKGHVRPLRPENDIVCVIESFMQTSMLLQIKVQMHTTQTE